MDSIAHAGGGPHRNRLCGAHHLDLCLACSNCLDDDGVVTRGIHCPHDIAGRGRKTSQVATAGHAAATHHGIARQLHHAHSNIQDGAAGKRAGRVDGNHADLVVAAEQFSHKMRDKGTFASIGAPVTPTLWV